MNCPLCGAERNYCPCPKVYPVSEPPSVIWTCVSVVVTIFLIYLGIVTVLSYNG
jgi:hypothetical protein